MLSLPVENPTAPLVIPKTYPEIRRENFSETLHGIEVLDPYRWLEDPDSDETKKFVDAQNVLFYDFISQSTAKEKINARLTELTNFERFGCPTKEGDSIYYWHNSGLQPQSVLYKQKSLDSEAKVFLDPNTFSEDGTVSVKTLSFSESGKYVAYGLSASGSDWTTIHVRLTADDATGEVEPTPIQWAKFTGIVWTHDDAGFFYLSYPKPESVSTDKAGTETDSNKNPVLLYHRLNTPQSEDLIVFKDPENPEHIFSATVTDDGEYLLLAISESCDPANKLYLAKLPEGKFAETPEFTKIVDKFEASYEYIANEGPVFYFLTTLNAPKRRIVKYDLNTPEVGFVEVVPQTEDVLENASVYYHDRLVLTYLHDVKNELRLYDLKTEQPLEPFKLPLPVGSVISSSTGKKRDDAIFYSFSSFLSPGKIYRYDFTTNQHIVFRETKVNGFDSDRFEVKQVFYPSKDGTKVPMYIVSKKGLTLDGNNPTLLYGYGGFNISITPTFSVGWITFMQHFNGIACIANIRGGGEYGEETWYWQGRREKKQNVFDDFQAAAKYLISENYTSPKKLAIQGGSNGGLLVAACLNQAPELFAAGVADVGVMDMLRFHKFTIGHAWVSDYGNPDNKEDFEVLLKYSPIHNVRSDKPYPAVLLTTSDHDDRVVPLHSYKLIAALQHAAKSNPNPLLIRIDTKSGHGAGKSTKQRIDESADKFTFLSLVLDAKWND